MVTDRLQDNAISMLTALLGKNNRMIPKCTNRNQCRREDEPIDSDPEIRESKHSDEEFNHKDPPKDLDVKDPMGRNDQPTTVLK